MDKATARTSTVFISYSTEDTAFALRLALDLERQGTKVLMDVDRVGPGEDLPTTLSRSITSSDAVVVLLSAAAVESTWVRNEIRWACDQEKRVYPVRMFAYEPEKLPEPFGLLARKRHTDLMNRQMFSEQYGGLLHALDPNAAALEERQRSLMRAKGQFSALSRHERGEMALRTALKSLTKAGFDYWMLREEGQLVPAARGSRNLTSHVPTRLVRDPGRCQVEGVVVFEGLRWNAAAKSLEVATVNVEGNIRGLSKRSLTRLLRCRWQLSIG